jgi:heme-degrading monooxygenase HmoA
MSPFAKTPRPPYYVVAFSSLRTQGDDGYGRMSDLMVELAGRQPGFLGLESVRDQDGFGITNSYWTDEAAIVAWKADIDHRLAQTHGRSRWYAHYELRIARVDRAYGFDKDD